MDTSLKLLELHASELAGIDGWRAYRWHLVRYEPEIHQLTGAVAPPYVRGPKTGRPNWKRKDRTTVRKIYITGAEHAEWLSQWLEAGGHCPDCLGEGRIFLGWSRDRGSRYRPCGTCDGEATLIATGA